MQITKLFKYGVIIVLLLFAGTVFWNYLQIEYVTASIPQRKYMRHFIYGSGFTYPVKDFKFFASASGYLKNVKVEIGDKVKKGQIIAEIDNSVDREKDLQSSSNLNFLRRKFDSNKKLYEKKIMSELAFRSLEAEFKKAESESTISKNILKTQLLLAQDDAIVLGKYKEEGEFVNQGDLILLTGQSTPVRVTASVDDDDVLQIKEGNQVFIMPEFGSNQTYEAKVTKITPLGDTNTKSFKIYIDLDPEIVIPFGLSVKVNIFIRENKNAMIIPSNAVFNDKVQIIENGKIYERRIVIGISNYNVAEVIDGISDQEVVLIPFRTDIDLEKEYKIKKMDF